eukprot:4267-Heterococcus_DN1.PRE.2
MSLLTGYAAAARSSRASRAHCATVLAARRVSKPACESYGRRESADRSRRSAHRCSTSTAVSTASCYTASWFQRSGLAAVQVWLSQWAHSAGGCATNTNTLRMIDACAVTCADVVFYS